MRLDTSLNSASPPAVFGAIDESAIPVGVSRRISRHMWAGCAVVGVFVVGIGVWAAGAPLTGAVPASGVVKVENNRKTVKHLESGIVRRILVHEGDHVREGQLLFVFDEAQPRAQLAVLQSTYDSLVTERARYEAEASGRTQIAFPPELLARRNDPSVLALLQAQQSLFDARRNMLASQIDVGRQRQQELAMQIQGVRAQVSAIDSQLALNKDELGGLETLYKGGYAPKTRLLSLKSSAAGLSGNRGEQVAAIARAEQAIGETRVQMLQAQQQRTAEAAAGLEQAQDKIADVLPRLAAARDVLSHTQVFSPADGYVLNLTQFTEGGVVGAGEPLLDIVPSNSPLVISAQVQPRDVHAVHPGMHALVTLIAYNTRTTPRVEAEVLNVSADQLTDQHTGKPYFTAELKIPPAELKRLPPEVKIYPGMPVQTSIVTGKRSVLDYIIGPLRDSLGGSMHEQ